MDQPDQSCRCSKKQAKVKTNPILFLQQVRQEASKVTWPSRNETVVTTIMVLIMVVLASFFFLGVDAVLKWLVEKVLFAITF
jgi:preprotein translocase subunit SecE